MKIKKFRKAILHVGGDKTGSKAIQLALDRSRDLLSHHGIFYPDGVWHAEFGSCFCDCPENYVFNYESGHKDRNFINERDARYLSWLRTELESVSDDFLVLSYEGYVSLDESALQKMRLFIDEYAETCEVVLYVRAPLSYAISAMSQRVKIGAPYWRDDFLPIFPFRHYLEKLCNVFGRESINVRKFDRDTLVNGDVVFDFLSVIQLPDNVACEIAGQSNDANTSLSAEALLIGQRIIELLEEYGISGPVFVQRFAGFLGKIKGGKIHLSAQQASVIRSASQAHCDYLATEFGIVFTEDGEESCYNNGSPQMSEDAVDSIAKFMVEQSLQRVAKTREVISADLQEKESVKCRLVSPDNMQTMVGLRSFQPSLNTSGKQGFLCYGPYIKLLAGNYAVHLLGDVGPQGLAGAYADVVHSCGQETICVQPLSISPSDGTTRTLSPPWVFSLSVDVNDIEIRIWVSEQSEINMRGIFLRKIDDDTLK